MRIGTGTGLGVRRRSADSYTSPADEVGNLVDTDISQWSQFRVTASAPSTLRETTDNATHVLRHAVSATGYHIHKFDIRPEGRTRIHIGHGSDSNTVTIDLSGDGAFEAVGVNVDQETISQVSTGIYRAQWRINLSGASNFDVRTADATSGLADAYAGDISKGYQIYTPRIVPESP
jgi:hypothetical protein